MHDGRPTGNKVINHFSALCYACFYNNLEVAKLVYAEELQYLVQRPVKVRMDSETLEIDEGTNML